MIKFLRLIFLHLSVVASLETWVGKEYDTRFLNYSSMALQEKLGEFFQWSWRKFLHTTIENVLFDGWILGKNKKFFNGRCSWGPRPASDTVRILLVPNLSLTAQKKMELGHTKVKKRFSFPLKTVTTADSTADCQKIWIFNPFFQLSSLNWSLLRENQHFYERNLADLVWCDLARLNQFNYSALVKFHLAIFC